MTIAFQYRINCNDLRFDDKAVYMDGIKVALRAKDTPRGHWDVFCRKACRATPLNRVKRNIVVSCSDEQAAKARLALIIEHLENDVMLFEP